MGLKALLANGYDGVGLGPILAEAGVPKGSFYHFFPSKEAFTCAVLEAYSTHYRENLVALLNAPGQPPLQRLENYFAALEQELRGEQPLGGCLYGVMAQTLASRSPALRATLQRCFALWQANLRAVLREAEDAAALAPGVTADAAAAFLIEAYEGALLRMKVEDSFVPYERFKDYGLRRLFR
ncbi:TetR family transcriptional regulator C-terminal domain-containing protein [Pseudomonas oryzihabitans]|uniref:TetR/AcrR family transcriptional regulator n=1 Tax=Pseudomonas oryzihabitans TaxID=47885 RepID=UPI0028943E4A|nr:TetR family transcriptional regulator C-terminal domain-containing protein [Pseudomonas oryzihabitans]MDT3720242.1 TetR family transcriptional regulator C-terminal domain-containing protein [Pseudomonas oryzihabitans]